MAAVETPLVATPLDRPLVIASGPRAGVARITPSIASRLFGLDAGSSSAHARSISVRNPATGRQAGGVAVSVISSTGHDHQAPCSVALPYTRLRALGIEAFPRLVVRETPCLFGARLPLDFRATV